MFVDFSRVQRPLTNSQPFARQNLPSGQRAPICSGRRMARQGGTALRLMVIGHLDGQLAAAARIAVDNGAPVRHVDRIETALAMLHAGPAADLMIVDVAVDIRRLAARLHLAGVSAPVVACGTSSDPGAAVAAVHAGAREYIPLPPDPEVIAAILAAVADDGHASPPPPSPPPQAREDYAETLPPQAGESFVDMPRPLAAQTSGAMAKVAHATLAAETVTRSLVGRTVADVERDLILETLKRCLGNRTHAAGILGISLRTLRNKLTVYAAEGVSVPAPNNGETRGAA
jgi:DNA-binding NtrC family response regulator